MNRQEFHQLMANAKQESGISTSAISFELKMLLPTLRRFEKGTNNSNMKKIFDLILIKEVIYPIVIILIGFIVYFLISKSVKKIFKLRK